MLSNDDTQMLFKAWNVILEWVSKEQRFKDWFLGILIWGIMQDEKKLKKETENEQHCVVILQNTLNLYRTACWLYFNKNEKKIKKKKKKENEQPGKWEKHRSQVKTIIFQTVDIVSFKIKYTNTHVGIYSFNKQEGPNQT